MPTYTIRNKETGETRDVIRSWTELQEILADGTHEQIIKAPAIIGEFGDVTSKVTGNFNDRLKDIKAGSGRDNTISTK